MQIETPTIYNGLSVIGGIVVAIAAALGLGNLLLAAYNRRNNQHDKDWELHETNRSKELDATSGFQERLIKRVENLETELTDMRTEQLAQARTNERLTVENENLRKENERQEIEIKELQNTVNRLEVEIAGSKAVFGELETTKALLLACESREPLGIEVATLLREEAQNIYENIRHIDFVPSDDPPSPQDAGYIRRLKEMKQSAKRMTEVI